jgi:hypothetical protein
MQMGKIPGLVSILFAFFFCRGVSGATWFVAPPPLGSDSNPGTARRPFETIQKGIDAADNGNTVVVAEGKYVENIEFKGKNIVLRSTYPLDPAVVANTIIDGDGWGFVVYFSGTEDETCVLSGFTIQNGLAHYGAGVRGGVKDGYMRAAIRNNVIKGNLAPDEDSFGAGLAWCGGTIENNIITGNSAEWGGGLCQCHGTIRNNVISGNWGINGGGLHLCDGTIQSNVISGNVASGVGGGVNYCWGTIQNNTIVGNYAAESGGGLYLCVATIRNCIVWGNRASSDAQLSQCSDPTHCCIQDWGAGGTWNTSSNPRFVSAGGWDDNNTPLDPSDDVWVEGNYRLKADSPCIDAGDNSGLSPPGVDMDGNIRITLGVKSLTVDMGAYEYNSPPFEVTEVVRKAGGAVQLFWNSQPSDTYAIWSRVESADGGWTLEDTGIPSVGTLSWWTDSTPAGRTKLYRVGME